MNAAWLTSSPHWLTLGWTMLHFLWVGGLLGLLTLTGHAVLYRATAQVRYCFACLCLLALTATPMLIAWRIGPMSEPMQAQAVGKQQADGIQRPIDAERRQDVNAPRANLPIALQQISDVTPRVDVSSQPTARSWIERIRGRSQALVIYLPWAWLLGSPAALMWLTLGVVGAERLKRSSRVIDRGEPNRLCRELARAMDITRKVTVAICDRISTPILVGLVRPTILLPAQAVTGWSPDQLELVLLHELAHVRRWDNLVNLLQRVIESLLFFHPAVWLVSAWVRAEREHCCDAIVVRQTGQPEAYAATLASLTETSSAVLAHAHVTSGMAQHRLVARIRRILERREEPMQVSRKSLAAAVLLFVVVVMMGRWSGVGLQRLEARQHNADIAASLDTSSQLTSEASDTKEKAMRLLREARNDQKAGRLDEARTKAKRAADLDVRYGLFDDRPDLVLADLERTTSAEEAKPTPPDNTPVGKREAVELVRQARIDLKAGRVDDARRRATEAKAFDVAYGLFDDSPDHVLADIQRMQTTNQIAAAQPESDTASGEEPGSIAPSDLRYDGKSFAEWRRQLLTELKPELRAEGLRAMGVLGAKGYGKEASGTILGVMADYEVHANSADTQFVLLPANQALQKIGEPCLPVLIDALSHDEANVRRFVVSFFANRHGRINAMGAVPTLLEIAGDDADLMVRYHALRCLSRLAPTSEQTLEVAIRATSDVESQIRAQAAETLYRAASHHPKRTVAALIAMLADDDANVRTAAIKHLSWVGAPSKPSVPALLKATRDPNSGVREAAIRAFMSIPAPVEQVVPAMVFMIKEENRQDYQHHVRAALAVLRKLGTDATEAVPALIEALGWMQTRDQKSVVLTLGAIGPDARAALPTLWQLERETSEELSEQVGAAIRKISATGSKD